MPMMKATAAILRMAGTGSRSLSWKTWSQWDHQRKAMRTIAPRASGRTAARQTFAAEANHSVYGIPDVAAVTVKTAEERTMTSSAPRTEPEEADLRRSSARG